MIQAARTIQDQPPGREVRMRVLRAGKMVDLTTMWSGAAGGSSPPRWREFRSRRVTSP